MSESEADYILHHSQEYLSVSAEVQGGIGLEGGIGPYFTVGLAKGKATELGGSSFYGGLGGTAAVIGGDINVGPGFVEVSISPGTKAGAAAQVHGGVECYVPFSVKNIDDAINICLNRTPKQYIIGESLNAGSTVPYIIEVSEVESYQKRSSKK